MTIIFPGNSETRV